MIPFYRQQTEWTCGVACVRMVLASQGIKKSEKELAKLLKTNKNKLGTLHREIARFFEDLKLNYVVMRNSSISDLKHFQKQKYCIIVGYFLLEHNCGHYAVVKKIGGKIHLIDPWYGPKHSYSIKEFKKIWYDGEGEKQWFVAVKN